MKVGIHVHCIQDDFCLEESVQRVVQQCQALGHQSRVLVSTPSHYWCGAPAIDEDVERIAVVAKRNSWEHVVQECRGLVSSRPAWQAETWLRNKALGVLADMGCSGSLIVDADELWYPDSLETVLRAAENHDVVYQSTVPVVGVPGYPIEGARDRGVSYLGPGVPIRYVRAAWMPGEAETTKIRWTKVSSRYFHFTMVRKTVLELVQKIRRGTHYGEQFYEFDRWIKEVLPGIRPGARNVSYFSDPRFENFWPLVRRFTREEWKAIPERVRPLLAPPEDQ